MYWHLCPNRKVYKYFVFQQTLKIVQEKIMISYNRANFCYFYNCYTFTFPRITQSLAFAERWRRRRNCISAECARWHAEEFVDAPVGDMRVCVRLYRLDSVNAIQRHDLNNRHTHADTHTFSVCVCVYVHEIPKKKMHISLRPLHATHTLSQVFRANHSKGECTTIIDDRFLFRARWVCRPDGEGVRPSVRLSPPQKCAQDWTFYFW